MVSVIKVVRRIVCVIKVGMGDSTNSNSQHNYLAKSPCVNGNLFAMRKRQVGFKYTSVRLRTSFSMLPFVVISYVSS